MPTKVSIKRSIAKTLTWRIIGTIDTTIITWFITGNPLAGLKVGGLETLTKMLLYYFHERAWYHFHFKGLAEHKKEITVKRHIYKTITWRLVGTVDTVILAWIVTGNPLLGIEVGGVELVTKSVLYYLHERVWYKFDFGVENRKKD